MTEGEFQNTVIELARIFKWRTAHFRPAQTAKGWRTPVSADGKGFPDLVMARRAPVSRLIFAELKSATGKLGPEQEKWIDALAPDGAANWETYLWKPDDLPRIAEILR